MKPSMKFMLIFFLTGITLCAQDFPRLDPDPAALKYARAAAGNGAYTWIELAEISFWASGDSAAGNAAPQGALSGMEQIRAAAAELRTSLDLPRTERDRAEYILTYIHKKFLRSYSRNQTRLDTLIAGGRYNCVSSAVLYMILARSCGLNVDGEMTKDHAFAVIRSANGSIDVETTSPLGFDPGSRREFNDEFGRVTGFAYVPARNYRDRAAVSPVELVSLILSNRISELESRSRFAESVPLAIDRAALLGAINVSSSVLSRAADVPAGGDSPPPFFESPRRDVMN
ncbi:MAG: hypothetical protein LBD48_06655, partial [Treponema sp.]|nr:hypothetical protein [Treponema sp.]